MEEIRELVNTLGPEIVYLLVMVGIWLAITAVYIAGTGIPETLAALAGGLGMIGLFFLPTNIWAFVLLIGAMVCFLAQIFSRRSWYLIVAGAVLQLAGSVFLFRLGSRPSVWTILVINAAALIYHQVILRPGLRIQDRPRMLDDETLIGQIGEVVKTLNPVGTVRVNGELWRARSEKPLEPGQPVRILRRKGLELIVAADGTQDAATERIQPAM